MGTLALPSVHEVRVALAAAGSRCAHLLRQVDDHTRPAVGTWSVGETAAHLSSSAAFFLAVARGEQQPERLEDVSRNNAEYLRAHLERRPDVLADEFEAGEMGLLAYVDSLDDDPTVELFETVKVPMSTLLAVELAEVLVHGHDIARASGARWPIPKGEAAVAVSGMLPMMPAMVDEDAATGVHARFDLRIRAGTRTVLAFDGPRLRLEEPSGRSVDCHLSADPGVSCCSASHGCPRGHRCSGGNSSPGVGASGWRRSSRRCSAPCDTPRTRV